MPFVQPVVVVGGMCFLERSPGGRWNALPDTHACQEVNEGIALLEPLGAFELDDVWNLSEDSDGMLDL